MPLITNLWKEVEYGLLDEYTSHMTRVLFGNNAKK